MPGDVDDLGEPAKVAVQNDVGALARDVAAVLE
jgi:hypothetical protein